MDGIIVGNWGNAELEIGDLGISTQTRQVLSSNSLVRFLFHSKNPDEDGSMKTCQVFFGS